MNYDNLKSMDLDQLKQLARSQGMSPHHKVKAPTLIKQIIEHVTKPPVQPKQEMKHPAEQAKEPPKMHTQEEVREAIKQFAEREGYQVIFQGETWTFRYKGAEDCGHMTVPMRVIRMKAETVSRGARNPKTMKFDGETIFAA